MKLIDTHCHLDLEDFDEDREDVIQRALDADIVQMVTIGIDPTTSKRAIELAEKYSFIFATIGHHPHDAKTLKDSDLILYKKLASHPRVVGFGEIGLDFYRNHSPRDIQMKRFDDLLQAGLETGLPIVIHDRDAHRETYEKIKAANAGRNGGIIHCFSGNYDLAKRFVDLGFHISIPGTVTYKNADVQRDVVKRLPLDSLLVETDAPFLAPVPRRGRRNEPSLVRYTAEAMAEIKEISLEELAAATTANARKVFHLPEPEQGA